MAYVPGFEFDVFISFAHLDNSPQSGVQWVTELHANLFRTLSTHSGSKEVEIWRDEERLAGNIPITETIERAVRRSAVFVCVVSRSFVESDWCPEELDQFCTQNNEHFDIKVNGKHRVIKVFPAGIESLGRNDLDLDLRGFQFYEEKPDRGLRKSFWPKKPDSEDQRYWVELDRLTSAIGILLSEMRKTAIARQPVVAETPDSDEEGDLEVFDSVAQPSRADAVATIYLADVTDDLYRDRMKLETALRQKSVRVLPERSLPRLQTDLEPLVRDALEESQLSIHMLSEPYGRPLEDNEKLSAPHLQYDLAREIAQNGQLERIVWVPPDVTHEKIEAPQKILLETIRNATSDDIHFDFQEGDITLKNLKRAVLQRISEPKAPPPDARKCTIFVTGKTDDLDHPTTQEMMTWLKGQHTVLKSDQEDINHRALVLCEGLMIVYGKEENKVDAEVRAIQAVKHTESRKRNPLTAAVFDAPPKEKADFGVLDNEFEVLNNRDGFDPASMDPFLEQLPGT